MLTLVGCAPQQPVAPDAAPSPGAAVQVEARHPISVVVLPTGFNAGLPRGEEAAGLVTSLLELGLADCDDVVPRVGDAPVPPGMAKALNRPQTLFTVGAAIGGTKDPLHVALRVCPESGDCVEFSTDSGNVADPTPAVAVLLPLVADAMGLPRPPPAVIDEWRAAQSSDPYAILMAGRASAVWFGLRPPVALEREGDWRADPIARAVRIDPDMPVGRWIAGRRALVRGHPDTARQDFEHAVLGRPSSIALAADVAAALSAGGHVEVARAAWDDVFDRRPGDPRFVLAVAAARLDAGAAAAASALLESLDPADHDLAAVAELRVAVAEALGAGPGYDALLATWQDAAPELAEPVRRRLRLRVTRGEYEDALGFVDVLAARGAADEAARLGIALAVALERWEDAANQADALGETELAAAVRGREALLSNPRAVPDAIDALQTPEARTAAAAALLAGGRPDDALARIQPVQKARPWDPATLRIEAEALTATGRDASAVKQRLALAEPAPVAHGPSTAAGSTGSGEQSQAVAP